MGNRMSCGLDSFGYIDRRMKQLVFQPPKTEYRDILKLNTTRSNLFNTQIKEIVVCGVHIKPIIRKLNKCIIMSHGNGCDIYTCSPYLYNLSDKYGIDVICYDYPEYGLTTGTPTEHTCTQCLESVVHYVQNKLNISSKNIILYGQSLGTGVTIDYLSKHHSWKQPVILVSPYKSIPKVVIDYSITDYTFNKYTFNSLSKIENIKCPIKIFHGMLDDLIHVDHSKHLYEKLRNKKYKLSLISNADHNNILNKIDDKEILEILNYDV